MADGLLVIGTRRYSSWSLRGWLLVHLAELDVAERMIPLAGVGVGKGGTPGIAEATPTGLVPYLEHDGARVWESLSIAEYCAELNPALWPAERVARAAARSMAAEMHAGFRALRVAMPMNLGRVRRGPAPAADVLADIARVETLWRDATRATRFLHSDTLGAADAMFAPVVCRFLSYLPELAPEAVAYCRAVRAHPLLAQWYEDAAREPAEWRLAHYEDVP